MILCYIIACATAKIDSAQPVQDTLPPKPWQCPHSSSETIIGTVESSLLNEVSGLSKSAYDNTRLWAHNDSGDLPTLYALSTQGTLLAQHTLPIEAIDWEDMSMAIDPHNQQSYLYIGDIGDNNEQRSSIQIHRIVEPVNPEDINTTEHTTYTLTYPDGAHNAEALIVHPQNHTLFILTKATALSHIYAFRLEDDERTLEHLYSFSLFDWGYEGSPLITCADITSDGVTLLLRTYSAVIAIDARILDGELTESPDWCMLESAPEAQGESITFLSSDSQYVTISEGDHPRIYGFDFSSER